MRIRSLLVIVSVFFASFVVVSCLGSGIVIEYSSDDTIYAFELDTVYGVNYAFTIDQVKGKIFNKDSMPVSADTIINKILITKLEVMGYALTGDSLLIMSDSLDLSKTMEKPLQLTVLALDGVSKKNYEVEVRVHRQEPDSLVWTQRTSYLLEGGSITGKPKAILLNDKILVYTPDRKVYWALLNNGNEGVWNNEGATNLPATTDLSSMLAFNDKLYVVTTDNKVLFSADGLSWSESTALSNKGVEALIGSFPTMIAGIRHDTDGKKFFCTTTSDLSGWEETGDELPNTSPLFPLNSISSTVYKTKTGIWKAFMMGNVDGETNLLTPWFSLDGLQWTAVKAPLSSDDAVNYSCPYISQPSIIHYGDKFYAFGNKFDAFYVSTEGITWSEVKKLVLFPEAFKGKSDYSVVVDKENYIWIVWGGGEVWRGRMNKFGFDIK